MKNRYNFVTPTIRQKRELKKKMDELNILIDKKIDRMETDTKEYRSLIKTHYQLFTELNAQ